MFKDEADFEKVVGRLNVDTKPNPKHRENLKRKMLAAFKEEQPATRIIVFRTLRRITMKNTFTKIAASIVVIAGILIGLHFAGNPFAATVTFADVIQPILNARTASLDIVIGSQGNQSEIHDDVMGSRIRRTISNVQSPDIIIDLEQQRLLTIDHAKKTAAYIELGGLSDLKNYVEVLRNSITRLQSEPDFQVENRGVEEFQGQDYLVFVASGENDTFTFWADPETALPVRIEHETPNMLIACDNLQFDVPFDESLFSMEVPDGYVVQDVGGIDFSDSSESAFIETLRIWAEIIEDGQFPESINLEDIVKIGLKFDQGMKRAGLTEEQQAEVATKWGQGLVFIRFFKGEGKWHYSGVGVELGDTETPIFWYRPQDSDTWRVIYGDLHVEDVEEEYLPEPEFSDRQAKILESSEQWEKQEFVGTEKDLWHVTAAGEIVAHSYITLTKVPQATDSMYIKLPYSGAVLESVTLDDEEIPFTQLIRDQYEVNLPLGKLSQSEMNLKCSWIVNMEALKKVDSGYRINLQSLIPVTSFKLTAVLEEDCGLEFPTKYVNDPSIRSLDLFIADGMDSAKMEMGSCGLPVNKSD
jgi:hypothetical protein